MELRHRPEIREKITTPGQYDLEFYRSYNYEDSKHFKINHYPSERKPDFFRREYKDEEFLSPANYSVDSRYKKVKTLKKLGKSYHVTNRYRIINNNHVYNFYTVTNMTQNRLDLISLKYYGTPIYWWLIAEANLIFDALTEIYVGRILKIPPLSSLDNFFNH